MKRPLIALAVLAALGTAGIPGINTLFADQLEGNGAAAAVRTETRTFTIENMTCAACPITVRKAMERVEGVKSVEVDFEARTATVVFDPAVVTAEMIARASTTAGYPAKLAAQDG